MGLRGYDGQGCILADDMGLGKTLMSITAMWTLLNQGFLPPMPPSSSLSSSSFQQPQSLILNPSSAVSANSGGPEEVSTESALVGDSCEAGGADVVNRAQQGRSLHARATALNGGKPVLPAAVRKVIVVCPTSLVGNWDNEIRKWVGERCPVFAVKSEPKKMIKTFLMHRGKGVLIISYETQRLYSKLFENALKNSIIGTRKKPPGAAGSEETEAGAISSSSSISNSLALRNDVGAAERAAVFHSNNNICDLLICDEAHKLKNADSNLARTLHALPARKRILLSGMFRVQAVAFLSFLNCFI